VQGRILNEEWSLSVPKDLWYGVRYNLNKRNQEGTSKSRRRNKFGESSGRDRRNICPLGLHRGNRYLVKFDHGSHHAFLDFRAGME
jgi:hypothetical protein